MYVLTAENTAGRRRLRLRVEDDGTWPVRPYRLVDLETCRCITNERGIPLAFATEEQGLRRAAKIARACGFPILESKRPITRECRG